MNEGNQTAVTEFILLGLWDLPELQGVFFGFFVVLYSITVLGNLIIMVIIKVDPCLHTPMYYFLINLAGLEICYISVTVPQMLANILAERKIISFTACIAQLYFFGSFGSTECFLLAIMAYDRYLAICYPLHYGMLMNARVCTNLIVCSWLGGFSSTLLSILLISRLCFCGPNKIKHYFCDIAPLLRLACSDTSFTETVIFLLASAILLMCCLLTVLSYVKIIATIVRIPSSLGREKAFSTCASHITVVLVYYGTMIFVYVRPTTASAFDFNKVASVLYTMVTPLINPFIYTLRNKDVKRSLRRNADRAVFLLETTVFFGANKTREN
ncbi:olfactory receptor 6N1-like [Rhinatrema bivittatum]|uniref:olfactory receptor 6N1-like n=1 Tax=Rhinatrema bivittatum TaxID=194408 RepID=UPI001127ECD5|nr:olfactory receptor 6N1-like [Rhinatrema bivittatum]